MFFFSGKPHNQTSKEKVYTKIKLQNILIFFINKTSPLKI